jgi:hypothetical protein
MFKITLIKSDQSRRYDITPIVGNFSWESDLSIIAALEMEVAFSDTRFFPKNPCDLGDHVILTKGSTEVFRGVIVDESKTGRNPIKYTVYDYAWYLCQSKTVYQFNNISATKAIERILNDFGMEIGSMISMPSRVDEIYMQKPPAHIIGGILTRVEQREGYTVNVEMRQGKIYFEKRQDKLIKGTFRLAENLWERDVLEAVGESSRTRSIEEMRNRIRLIVEDDKTEYEITAEAEDTSLIEKYGLLEETLKIDTEDAAKSRQVAKVLLKRLGMVHETNKITLIGDIRFKGGYLFDVKEPVTGMTGRMMISSVKHSVSKQLHRMNIELVFPEDVA